MSREILKHWFCRPALPPWAWEPGRGQRARTLPTRCGTGVCVSTLGALTDSFVRSGRAAPTLGGRMTQPYYAPYPPPQAVSSTPSRTGAITALVIGAVLLVVGPVLGVLIGSFAMIPPALDTATQVVSVSPSGTVDLRRGASVYLMAPEAATPGIGADACVASTEAGTSLPVAAAPSRAWTTSFSGERYRSFATVTAAEAGMVTITCADARVPVMTMPAFNPGALLRPLAWWALGGTITGVVGLVLLILGIVGHVRRPKAAVA